MSPEEINARIKQGINDGVQKYEEGKRLDVLFAAIRAMDRDERARAVRKIVEMFGFEAGITEGTKT